MIMKVPPAKPHFFKPILPGGFTDAIEIPASFFKYLAGKTGHSDHALLRKGGEEWRVKINGQFLREGWTKFATENNLKPGDIVVFEHEGNMAFKVLIFDLSHCEKEEESGNGNRSPSRNPHFVSTIKPYSVHYSFLNVPIEFARSNGLASRSSEIILKDECERSWKLDLKPNGKGPSTVRIRRGAILSEFLGANGFKEGDSFKFELVGNGKTPVACVLPYYHFADEPREPVTKSDKGKRAKPASPELESGCDDRRPCFTSTIIPSNLKRRVLNMPMKFARSNGLFKKEKMIIVGKRERSWPVGLKLDGPDHFRIQNGWAKFCKENGIKVGDSYKFELIENGRVPVALFTLIPGTATGSSVLPGSKVRKRGSSNTRILS